MGNNANHNIQHLSAEMDTQTLMYLVSSGKMTPESLEAFMKGLREEMRRKEILEKHTPPIRQLPTGKWYTRVDGKLVQRVDKKKLEDLVVSLYDSKAASIATIYEDFLSQRKKTVADTTWAKGDSLYQRYIHGSKLERIPLTKLRLKDGYDFVEYCLEIKPDLKKKYWQNILGLVNKIMEYAISEEMIERNPFENLRPKKDLFTAKTYTRDGDTVFSKAEQAAVCAVAIKDAEKKNISEPLGIVLNFNLGLRIGELCALRWGDIETTMKGETLHVQRMMVEHIDEDTKKKKGFEIVDHCKTDASNRKLLLNEKAKEVLQQIKEYNQKNGIATGFDDLIFIRMYKKKHCFCTPRSFDPRLRRYCRIAGMTVIKSPHDVRRSVLTNLYMAGMPLKKIQEYAGHTTLRQTMDYLRIPDDDMDVMQYLNSLSDNAYCHENIAVFSREA